MYTSFWTSPIGIGLFVGAGAAAWYVYQICSRKVDWIRFKVRRALVGLAIYGLLAALLTRQPIPLLEALIVSVTAAFGGAWLLVSPPRQSRRAPKAVRKAAIERDLTSKGLKWDPAKYHLDHLVPFSKHGDNSLRNVRVLPKEKNLKKGARMPSPRDFF